MITKTSVTAGLDADAVTRPSSFEGELFNRSLALGYNLHSVINSRGTFWGKTGRGIDDKLRPFDTSRNLSFKAVKSVKKVKKWRRHLFNEMIDRLNPQMIPSV